MPCPSTSLATEKKKVRRQDCDGQSAPEMAPSTHLGHRENHQPITILSVHWDIAGFSTASSHPTRSSNTHPSRRVCRLDMLALFMAICATVRPAGSTWRARNSKLEARSSETSGHCIWELSNTSNFEAPSLAAVRRLGPSTSNAVMLR